MLFCALLSNPVTHLPFLCGCAELVSMVWQYTTSAFFASQFSSELQKSIKPRKRTAQKCFKLLFSGVYLQSVGPGSWWIMPQSLFLQRDNSVRVIISLCPQVLPVSKVSFTDFSSVFVWLFLFPHSCFMELSFQNKLMHLSPVLGSIWGLGGPNWDKGL